MADEAMVQDAGVIAIEDRPRRRQRVRRPSAPERTVQPDVSLTWSRPRQKTRKPRHCYRCGRKYLRRSLVITWVEQNPGHRAGWQREEQRVCTQCIGASAAKRLLMAAVRFG